MPAKIRPAVLLAITWLFASSAAAADRVPFHAVIDTQPVVVGSCGVACIRLEISGSGQATHLGRTDVDGPSQVNLITGVQTGTSTLTAANGDAITIAFVGVAMPTGPNPTDPVNFHGAWQVIAGTGRFENASGSGTYTGRAAGPEGTLELIGSISRVGQK